MAIPPGVRQLAQDLARAGRQDGDAAMARLQVLARLPPKPQRGQDILGALALATLEEVVHVLRALPGLEPAPDLHPVLAWGLRHAAEAVFAAAALDSPLPARWLDEPALVQAVLKTVHLGLPLERFHHPDPRFTPAVRQALAAWVRERRSAVRAVPDVVTALLAD